ncbi:GntR family transcriptional regulator [Actinoplanes derwentensis]|uniref:DNA-binding transcriptional regulator, GntR family n=1 Tax=Actinoplanes derwentensis TaxID=113562 RepID=A0A1H1ZGS6_9ACTN|nr:GntR family transcriptional regulator [Actinoplanes derwentensis]GID82434.1 GntR family transcriptional regulator [Actinoplanes derwentensis]SDT32894.1 DNA-binding transcriptional regulator, GntR family [Actinoplanes derwentensis]
MDPVSFHASSALVDDTAAAIRARIMSGEIPIGAQLRQAELAKTLGVSRTPVREALRQLQTGGLIVVVPNRGAVVRVPAPWEVREAYEVRAELEGLSCARAVRRITRDSLAELRLTNELLRPGDAPPDAASHAANDRFHTMIHHIAGNERLARVIKEINEAFPRNVSALVLHEHPRHRADNFAEHERILAALDAEDADTARREMQAHVIEAGEQLARWYERRSGTVFHGPDHGFA